MKRKDLTVVSLKLLEDKKINHIYFRFREKISSLIGKERFAIAVSGGSDSLALSVLAKLYSLENDNDFVSLIIDHKLRKESAEEAKQTYKSLTQKKIKAKILTYQGKKFSSNIQKKARDLRYDLFEKYFELANFLRANKNYTKSIELYEKSIASKKDKRDDDWIYYYNLAISQERAGVWENAEKNFLQALKISPKQPEVLNYLAYSWLEKKINLDQAKEMLIEAVSISKGQGYILDSLGWAYFLLKDFDKAEELLQIAYEKEPSEAVIYDHYGDVLWTNGKEIQARYVWQNAIKLKNIEKDLKEAINNKIIFGLENVYKNKS